MKRLDGLDNHIKRIDAWQGTSEKRTDILELASEKAETSIKENKSRIDSLEVQAKQFEKID